MFFDNYKTYHRWFRAINLSLHPIQITLYVFDMRLDVAEDCLLHNVNIANGAYAKLVVAKYQWTTHRDSFAVKGNLYVCFATIQIDVATNFRRIATNNS